jgi:hypothetical protein
MMATDGGAGAAARVLTMAPPRIATPDEAMLAHVRSALGRGLPMPQLCRPHGRTLSVAGGGPSLAETYPKLDGVIVTANAGLGFLLSKGIIPWACGLLDARPHIADLIEPHPDVFYFVASTCHPSVFDKLKDCKVILWHPSGLPGISETLPRGTPMIAGGTTMGMRWLNLAHYMGFRKFEMHGLDSSYRGDKTHAYPDSRDGKAGTIEINGYVTDNNFLTQCTDWFQLEEMFALDDDKPIVNFHGDGLLQSMVRARENLIRHWPRRPDTKPLNVICVATGDYLGRGEDYVSHLLSGVAKHYKGEAKFHVLREGPASWWAKMQMFEPGRFPKGERCVYFDLDTIITGDLTDLMEYDGPFAGLRDVWQPGQMGSGVMTWTSGELDHVWNAWVEAGKPTDDPRGDQAFITQHMPMAMRLQDLLPDQLGSWKANFGMNAANIGPDVRAVYYHGEPRPHETELWNSN